MGSSDPLHATVHGFLDDVSAATPAPGAGAAAALVVALGAALVEMAARLSPGREGTLAAAQALRTRVAPLGQSDAEAYEAFLAARRRGADDTAAHARAVAVPLEIAECALQAAVLAAWLAEHGNPNLRGESIAAAVAASAGAAIAAMLVEINLQGPDERIDQARRLAAAAAEYAAAARGHSSSSPT